MGRARLEQNTAAGDTGFGLLQLGDIYRVNHKAAIFQTPSRLVR